MSGIPRVWTGPMVLTDAEGRRIEVGSQVTFTAEREQPWLRGLVRPTLRIPDWGRCSYPALPDGTLDRDGYSGSVMNIVGFR